MATYKVLQRFLDKQTNVVYEVGDFFPSDTNVERLKELQATNSPNRDKDLVGKQLIEEVKEEFTKPTEKSTKSDIQAYLSAKNINTDTALTKAQLLELVE